MLLFVDSVLFVLNIYHNPDHCSLVEKLVAVAKGQGDAETIADSN